MSEKTIQQSDAVKVTNEASPHLGKQGLVTEIVPADMEGIVPNDLIYKVTFFGESQVHHFSSDEIEVTFSAMSVISTGDSKMIVGEES
jgi:hypothetical protein